MHMTARALHILSGSLAIVFGFVALYAAKGGRVHRRSGMVFVYAMLAMALLGAVMAVVWGRQPASNTPVGLLTAYLVTTALTTVRRPGAASHALDQGLMSLAMALGLTLYAFGAVAFSSPHGTLKGMPAIPFFIFGSIAFLSGIGDLRMIRSGGVQALRGARRIARHLWRMSLALLIAVFSFFLGQAQVIPKAIRIVPLLLLPPLAILLTLLYWVWRVRVRTSLRGVVVSLPEHAGVPAVLSSAPSSSREPSSAS